MRKIFLITIGVFLLSGCGDMEDTEEYQAGYDAGYDDGLEAQRSHICDAIERADDHAYETLQEERI